MLPGIQNENLVAQNSFVILSSLQSTISLSDKIRLFKGSDVPHGSITGNQAVPELPDPKKTKQ